MQIWSIAGSQTLSSSDVEVYVESSKHEPRGGVQGVAQVFVLVEHGRHLLEVHQVPPGLAAEDLQGGGLRVRFGWQD